MNKYEKIFAGLGSLFMATIFLTTGTIAGGGMRMAVAAPLYWLGLISSDSVAYFTLGTWLPW